MGRASLNMHNVNIGFNYIFSTCDHIMQKSCINILFCKFSFFLLIFLLIFIPTLAYRRTRGDQIELFKHFHAYYKTTLPYSFNPRDRASRKHDFQPAATEYTKRWSTRSPGKLLLPTNDQDMEQFAKGCDRS